MRSKRIGSNFPKFIGLTGRFLVTFTFPILAAGAIGVGVTGFYLNQVYQGQVETARIEEMTSQARLLGDSVLSGIDVLKARALDLQLMRGMVPGGSNMIFSPDGAILHWAEVQTERGSIQEVKQTARNPLWFKGGEIEKSYLEIVKKNLRLSGNLAALRLRLDAQSPKEWLALGFGTAQDSKAVVILVDPMEAFGAFRHFSRRGESGNLRSYLVGRDGAVLAHSQVSYVGSNFSAAAVFSRAVKPLLNDQRSAGAGTYEGIDRIRVTAGFTRLESLPFAVVVEKVIPVQASVQSGGGVEASIFWPAVGASLAFSLLMLFSAWSVRRNSVKYRNFEDTLSESVITLGESNLSEITGLASDIVTDQRIEAEPAIQSDSGSLQRAQTDLMATQNALRNIQDEQKLISEFEQDATRLKDPRKVAQRLTAAASQLCGGSPALFFSFQDNLGMAVLQADAGFPSGQAPVDLSFEISEEALDRVMVLDKQGKSASFANYDPLARILLNRLGVAHYEGWAVSGYGFLGRQGGKPRLLGVLVILQAGYDSVTRHESLSRMIRSTGLIYENSILSR